MPEMTCINSTGSRQLNSSNGCTCFVKEQYQRRLKFVGNNAQGSIEYSATNILEINLLKLKLPQQASVYICYLYKHPKLPQEQFLIQFMSFLETHFTISNGTIDEDLFVLGDFNIDALSDNTTHVFDTIQQETGLKIISPRSPTTDKGTMIDIALSNCLNGFTCETYESYYSDHKPLCLTLW